MLNLYVRFLKNDSLPELNGLVSVPVAYPLIFRLVARALVVFDTVVCYSGYEASYVRNITGIDDKIDESNVRLAPWPNEI